jgi:hypothetical protein
VGQGLTVRRWPRRCRGSARSAIAPAGEPASRPR